MNLPAVLACIGILAALAAAIASAGFNAPVLPARALSEAQTVARLEAVVSRVALALYDQRATQRPAADGNAFRVEFDGAVFAVTLTDELGRIDLNNADATAIGGILMVAGADGQLANNLTQQIMARRPRLVAPRRIGDSHLFRSATGSL